MSKWWLSYCLFACMACTSQYAFDNPDLLWAEEFDDARAIDEAHWTYDLGDGCPTLCGWGNNELQRYTNNTQNIRVEDGKLIIEAHATKDSAVYSSARITTKGKQEWKYAYIEVRAKIPSGKGTWPAIWMLPVEWKYGGWPDSGEIDIMEHVGYDPGVVHGTVHTAAYNHIKGTQRGKQYKLDSLDNFNLYAVNWTPEKIDFIINNQIYHTFENNGQGSEHWPYDHPYYLIMNIAVGGNWGGRHGVATDIWPQRMEIDYIRVYNYKSDYQSTEISYLNVEE